MLNRLINLVKTVISGRPYSSVTTRNVGENEMKVFITPVGDQFAITNASGIPVQTYSRRRDAVRGATRRGFTVAG